MEVPRHDLDPLVAELRTLREKGLLRIRHHPFPALTRAGEALGMAVDQLLEHVVSRLDGQLADATAYTLGTAAGTRDWAAQDRRRRAASLYGVTPERFRKQQEILILENVAQEILNLLATARPVDMEVGASLPLRVGNSRVTVHHRAAESLCDIDVITSSENIYLEMSKSYKSSLSACLRKAAAVRDDAGAVIDDVLPRELREWMRSHKREGGTVAAGTVVPTSSGELRHQGIRQIYHAAVVAPGEGGNSYDVEPSAIMRAVRNVFTLARQNGARSVCLPLFGAGRGGLDPVVAFSHLWPQLARELGGPCAIHLVARSDRGLAAILSGLRRANDTSA
ncbi:macro domain-containing protein [Nonomuraea sp. NPDC050556]|uniref:macro domain-containing protein n=1 Tax=Nonomuraea sp. NPDC050556 TaxID=3364369 RepID=UPI0037BCAE0C